MVSRFITIEQADEYCNRCHRRFECLSAPGIERICRIQPQPINPYEQPKERKPHFYHAYGNQTWKVSHFKIILRYVEKHGLNLRAWHVPDSNMSLMVVKDPDTSEDSGMELYGLMMGKFESYGLASVYEYERWGIDMYIGQPYIIREAPNSDSMSLSGFWIGKDTNNMVIVT